MDICCLSITALLQALYKKRKLYRWYLETRSKFNCSVQARKSVNFLPISRDFCRGKYFYSYAWNGQKTNLYIYIYVYIISDTYIYIYIISEYSTILSYRPFSTLMKISFRIPADIPKEFTYYPLRVLWTITIQQIHTLH